jgi:VWFA-related protein
MWCIVWVATLLASTATAQVKPEEVQGGDRRPSFSAAVLLVRTDVMATDQQRRVVSDLLPSEFVLEQDGKRQQLLGAWFVGAAEGLGAGMTEPRHLLFVVDDEHMRPENAIRVKQSLEKLIPEVWQTGDTGSVFSTALLDSTEPLVAADAASLLAQVAVVRPIQPEALALRPFSECDQALPVDPLAGGFSRGFSRGTLAPVERALAAQSNCGRRTVVLLLTDGVVDERCLGARSSAEERLRRLADFATRRNAVIYGLMTAPFSSGVLMPQHRGPNADVARRPPSMSPVTGAVRGYLRTVAERTGGFAIRSNDIGDMVRPALAEQSGYYILAYEPPAGTFTEAEGSRYRRLSVRCTRRGVTCRGRSGFYSVADDGR